MKKFLYIVLAGILLAIPLSAKEGDIHVTKTDTAIFNLDAGATVISPLDSTSKSFGVFGALTFTPVSLSRFNGGIKAELSLNGLTGTKRIGATGLFLARAYVVKSFEVYAGIGARFIAWDLVSVTDFSHSWGVVIQGGARGRLRNWLGVGVQLSFLRPFGDALDRQLEIQFYASLEI